MPRLSARSWRRAVSTLFLFLFSLSELFLVTVLTLVRYACSGFKTESCGWCQSHYEKCQSYWMCRCCTGYHTQSSASQADKQILTDHWGPTHAQSVSAKHKQILFYYHTSHVKQLITWTAKQAIQKVTNHGQIQCAHTHTYTRARAHTHTHTHTHTHSLLSCVHLH
jgi:hypothetical protein